jgi:hypothetical protein
MSATFISSLPWACTAGTLARPASDVPSAATVEDLRNVRREGVSVVAEEGIVGMERILKQCEENRFEAGWDGQTAGLAGVVTWSPGNDVVGHVPLGLS